MAYRETCCYSVLCDGCGITAPEGTGWRTPDIADRAALEAGWVITPRTHLCLCCCTAPNTSPNSDLVVEVDPDSVRPGLAPATATAAPDRMDLCWPPVVGPPHPREVL